MIRVLENTAYPYQGVAWQGMWTGTNRRHYFTCLNRENLPYANLEPGYLRQGKHDHRTGWSSVLHFKAKGTVMRLDDGAIHKAFPSDINDAKPGQLYITNCFQAKGNASSKWPSLATTSPGIVATLVHILPTSTTTTYYVVIGAFRWVRKPTPNGRLYLAVALKHAQFNPIKGKWTSSGTGTSANIDKTGTFVKTDQWNYDVATTLMNCRNAVSNDSNLLFNSVNAVEKYTTNYYQPADCSPTPLSDDDIVRPLRREGLQLSFRAHDYQQNERMQLQATSFDSINRFDGNMLALCVDLRHVGSSSVDVVTNLMKASKNPRKLASAWLSARYGDKLTYGDLVELFAGFNKSPWKVTRFARFLLGRSRKSGSFIDQDFNDSYSMNCEIAVKPDDLNALMKAVRTAYEWDFYPSLGNMWDLVPLSFVVDWFVDVSSIFEDIDRLVQARYYTVLKVLESIKASCASHTFPSVELSYYDRSLSNELSLGMSSVQLGLPSPINIVDGVSLILM